MKVAQDELSGKTRPSVYRGRNYATLPDGIYLLSLMEQSRGGLMSVPLRSGHLRLHRE